MADQSLSCRETTGLQVYRVGRANLAESVRARVGEEAGWRVGRWGWRVEGVSGGEGRIGLVFKRDGRARMLEA